MLLMSKDIYAYGKLSSLYYDATEKYALKQEVDFFASWIEMHPGRVLEAMSGSGRLQIPLIQRGYLVDGVDHSRAMLERCLQRCAILGVELELYEQSLENLSLPHRYNTIFVAFGSIQLISARDQLLQVLKNFHAHMLPGGNLLLDIFIPDITIEKFSISSVRLDERTIIYLKKRHLFDVKKKLVTTFGLYEQHVDGIVKQQEDELIEIVWYSDQEWKELLFQAGFEIVKIYDEQFKQSEDSRVIHAQSVVY